MSNTYLPQRQSIIVYTIKQLNSEGFDYNKTDIMNCIYLFEYYDDDKECIEPFRESGHYDYKVYKNKPYSIDVIETIEELEESEIIQYTEDDNINYTIHTNIQKHMSDPMINEDYENKLEYVINLYTSCSKHDLDLIEYSLQLNNNTPNGQSLDQEILHNPDSTPKISYNTILSKII